MSEPDDIEPTNADYSAALRLARKHLYEGDKPHALARMLAEYRCELERSPPPWVVELAERWIEVGNGMANELLSLAAARAKKRDGK